MPLSLVTNTQNYPLKEKSPANTSTSGDQGQEHAFTVTEFGNLIISKTIHAGTVDETKTDISKWQGCGLNEYGFYAVNNATPVFLTTAVGFSNDGWGDCTSGELRIGDNVKESSGTLLGNTWLWFHPIYGLQTKGIDHTETTLIQSTAQSVLVDGYVHTGPTYNESTGVIKGCGLNEYGVYGVGDSNVSKFLLAADDFTFSPSSTHWGDSIEAGEIRVGDNVQKSGSTLAGDHWIWFSPTYGWQTKGVSHEDTTLVSGTLDTLYITNYLYVNANVKLSGVDGKIYLGTDVELDETGITGPGFYLKSGGMFSTQGTIGGFTISATNLSSSDFSIDSNVPSITLGDPTGYNTGNGFWVGSDAGVYKVQIGDAAGDVLLFDGSTLSANNLSVTNGDFSGSITATSGTIGGWLITSTSIKKSDGTSTITLDQNVPQIVVSRGSNYVAMDVDGLKGYDSTLGQTFYIPIDGSPPIFSSGIITETEYQIYTSGVIKTSDDPTVDGGLLINNASLTGYDSTGKKVIQLVYDGTYEGDAYFGDYDGGNQGFFYDHSAGTCHIRANIQDETPFEIKTANFTAEAGGKYAVDTSTSEIQMTLPASPTVGAKVQWVDYANNFGNNNLKILGNGQKIMGYSADLWCTNDYEGGMLEYTGTSYGWELI